MNRFVAGIALGVVGFGAIIAGRFFSSSVPEEAVPAVSVASGIASGGAVPGARKDGLPVDSAPLPALGSSDAEMRKALAELFGAEAVDAWLKPDAIIRHIVAFVDSLPRKHIGADAQPIKPIVGGFIATGDEQATPLSAENAAKYTPYVAVIRKVNPKLVSEVYSHYRPLFQQAYEELTKTDGRFDDRVLQAIDGLIDAPEIREPVLVIRRDAFYEFVDPNLEQLSVGQKFMIRLGPDNAAAIKSTLRSLRTSLVADSSP